MTTLKKAICILLSLFFLAASLCACAGSGNPAETEKPSDSTTAGEDTTETLEEVTTYPRVEDSLPSL